MGIKHLPSHWRKFGIEEHKCLFQWCMVPAVCVCVIVVLELLCADQKMGGDS